MVYLNARQAATHNITVRVLPPSPKPQTPNPVLTQICGFQVPQCGNLTFAINTTPPTTPPYSLIVYDNGGSIPTVYPLTVDRRLISWTVVYPARQSRSFLPTSVHQSHC